MSLGIFVVGQSERVALPLLLRKLGQSSVHVRLAQQDDMLDVDQMERHVRALKGMHREVRRVIIFKDSERADPETTLRESDRARGELNARVAPVTVDYVIVDHSLEGWLACDEMALRTILGRNARLGRLGNPDAHLEPAKLLQRVFRANKRDFKKTQHNPQLAERADVRVVADRSPTFQRLVELLRGP